jgi:hypothetical protein
MSTVAVAGDGVALLYAAIILMVLSWITVSMRVAVRVWRKVLGMDDYLMVIGLVCISSLYDEVGVADSVRFFSPSRLVSA